MDQPEVDVGLFGQAPGGDPGVSDLDQEPLGRVQQSFPGIDALRRLRHPRPSL